jgi:hypothetical protein
MPDTKNGVWDSTNSVWQRQAGDSNGAAKTIVDGGAYLEFTGTAGAADNALIYTSGDVSAYNIHYIFVSGTNSADVEVSFDGTNYSSAVSVLLADDVTTGGGIKAITIPTGKVGILEGKFKNIRVRQDGVTDADATGAHGVV